MKTLGFSLVALLSLSALAQKAELTSVNFAAPIVQDRNNMPGDTQFGSIVFDNSMGSFYGLSNVGTWSPLGIPSNTDVSIHGVTAGIGSGSVNTNTVFGSSALAANTSGYKNSAFGNNALKYNTTGYDNVATGMGAMENNTTGYESVGVGSRALYSSTTGQGNSAVGFASLYTNASGGENVAFGVRALLRNTTGSSNTALGTYSLVFNETGSNNVAIGTYALQNFAPSVAGTGYNTVIGAYSGTGIITGTGNTIIGAQVGGLLSTLTNNVIIADGAGNQRINVDSTGNVGLGTTAPTTKLQVAGVITPSTDNSYSLGNSSLRFTEVYATNGTINTSDAREKKDVKDSALGLNFIKKLRPVSYKWKSESDQGVHYGLIAQETEAVVNEVSGDSSFVAVDPKTNRYGLRYSELISPIIKSVQELSEDNQKIHNELDALKNENAQLKAEIRKILNQLN